MDKMSVAASPFLCESGKKSSVQFHVAVSKRISPSGEKPGNRVINNPVSTIGVCFPPTWPVGIVLLEVLSKSWGFVLPEVIEFEQPVMECC